MLFKYTLWVLCVVCSVGAQERVHVLAPSNLGGFFDCLRTTGHAVVAAHRGGPSPGYAENAIETMAHVASQVPALYEIDIARTRDNVLVLMHDDTLDRTTTGMGDVRAHTLAQVKALRLKDDRGTVLTHRVPTLREALDWAAGKVILELDVKRGVSYEDVIAEVRAAGAMARVVFITYSLDAAERVHQVAPEMMLSVSIESVEALAGSCVRGAIGMPSSSSLASSSSPPTGRLKPPGTSTPTMAWTGMGRRCV